MKTFAELFKKYRLRAEFETFAAFGDALSEKSYFYEESIFSHWQKGTRVPSDRQLLLTMIAIFVEKEAVKTMPEANEFLASAGQGYLTENEINQFQLLKQSVFQVPNAVADFTGREKIIAALQKEKINGKTLLIHGQAGVGKTTLAIKLGYILRHQFPDGVLWYRMETSKLKDIMISIARLLGEELPKSNDTQVTASFIRSVLARKKVLLLFDNVDKESNLHLLLPHGSSSAFIILSRQKDLYLPTDVTFIFLESFSEDEVLNLFKKIFDKTYIKQKEKTLLSLGSLVGNLPLAVHALASQLKQSGMSPEVLLEQGKKESHSLYALSYENKNLYLALNISYKNLSEKAQAVFLSLGVFEGKDFSLGAISYMNGMTTEKARIILDELHNASLIETSLNNKFRIHPMVKKFISEKLTSPYLLVLTKISASAFIIFTLYWISYQFTLSTNNFARHMFGSTYFVIALWGSIWGVKIANKWGGVKSIMGKAILFFSLGLFAQAFGQVTYSYYDNVLHMQIPYPTLGDIGYFGTIPLFIFAVILLGKAAGIKWERNLFVKHSISLAALFLFLSLGYYLLLQQYIFDWSNPLKIFLDFAYPLGDGIYTYLALLIYIELKKSKNNIMKSKVMLFFIALLIFFLSDYVFIYQANSGTWHVGQINDLMYLAAYVLMTFAILRLNSGLSKIVHN